MLTLVILILLFILVTIICQLRVKIALEYVRNENDDNLVMSFYTLKGIFKYKYEIPIIDTGARSIKFKLVKEQGRKEKNVGERKERLHINELIDKLVTFKRFCDENDDLVCFIRRYFYNKVLLFEFYLDVREGTGNACYTGILSGVLWSVAGYLTSYLSNVFKHIKKRVTIKPYFNSKIFTVDFVCIFHTRFAHIIMVLVRVLIRRHRLEKVEKVIGGGMSG